MNHLFVTVALLLNSPQWVIPCRQLKIHTTANSKVYQVQSITGRALSRHDVRLITEPITLRIGNLHEEDIKLLVLEEANTDIILGRPWFVLHEPQIFWRTGDILKWGDQCFPDCFPNLPRPSMPVSQTLSLNSTSIKSPIEKQSVEIPECYAHFSDVVCPTKASQLPPHRPWDCAIDLLPGESVPKGKIYPLSLPDRVIQHEPAGSIPGTRGYSTTSSHASHLIHYINHFRINHHNFFADYDRQSHGQTNALLWCGRGVQRFSSAMFTLHWNATTSLFNGEIKSFVHHLTPLWQGFAVGWNDLGSIQ